MSQRGRKRRRAETAGVPPAVAKRQRTSDDYKQRLWGMSVVEYLLGQANHVDIDAGRNGSEILWRVERNAQTTGTVVRYYAKTNHFLVDIDSARLAVFRPVSGATSVHRCWRYVWRTLQPQMNTMFLNIPVHIPDTYQATQRQAWHAFALARFAKNVDCRVRTHFFAHGLFDRQVVKLMVALLGCRRV